MFFYIKSIIDLSIKSQNAKSNQKKSCCDNQSISLSTFATILFADICDVSTWVGLNILEISSVAEGIFDSSSDYICNIYLSKKNWKRENKENVGRISTQTIRNSILPDHFYSIRNISI